MKMNNFHENKENKKKISKLLPWIIGGVIALSPNVVKGQMKTFNDKLPLIENKNKIETVQKLNRTTTDDEYEWRKLWYIVDVDGYPVEFDSLRWAFKKNGEPINDTTYTLNVAGTTYVCGIYADTVVHSDSTEVNIVTYTYIEEPYDSLQAKDPSADFFGDSVETNNRWVHVLNNRYWYPDYTYTCTDQNTYYQQYEDGSVDHNGGTAVGYEYEGVTYEKSYMVDNTVYYLSISLDVNEPVNKPQMINLKVYPNPANIYFNVKLSNKSKGVLTLYDLEGRVIDKKIINNKSNVKIDASGLNSGNYILVFETDDGTKVSKRITLVK